MPNVQSISVQPKGRYRSVAADFLLPMLRHPSAQQLRVLDVSRLFNYRCSHAELQQLPALPHLHSLSFGDTACDDLTTLQPLSLIPSLTHLGLDLARDRERVFPCLALCSRLVSLELSSSIIRTELVNCLAQLPSLQRLQLRGGDVKEQTADAWAALRSLREIQLDMVPDANQLLLVLSSVPMLRLLRWHCRAPTFIFTPHDPFLPTRLSLRSLMTDAPLLQVALVMPRSFDNWPVLSDRAPSFALQIYQRRMWEELRDLAELPEPLTRIVEPEPEEHE
jgi:hypothetical protein